MATTDQVRLVLVRLHSLGNPRFRISDDPEAFERYEAEYIAALQCFTWNNLQMAMDRVRDSWIGMYWAPPAFIVKKCLEIERDSRPLTAPLALPELPPPAEVTEEEAEVMRLKLERLLKILKSGKIVETDARAYCDSGNYPEHWLYISKTEGVTSGSDTLESPKPPPTPRQAERAGSLQRRANAWRAADMAAPLPGSQEEKINANQEEV